MSIRRSLFVLAVITIILPLGVFAQRAGLSQLETTAQNANLQLYTVGTGDVALEVNATGSVEANEVVQLSLTTPGRVQDVLAEEGAYVLKDDVLVRLENESQRIAYEQASLALDTARLNLQELTAPVDEKDIQVAEANVQAAWAQVYSIENSVSSDDLHAAELRYEQAQQAHDDAVKARTTAQGGQSDQAYLVLDAKVGQTSFNMEIARLQLESLRTANRGQQGAAYARALQAERQLEQVKAGPTTYQVEQAEIAVRQAEIQLEQATTAYDRTTLVAPFDGIVSRVDVEDGSLVAPGVPVLEMTNISPLHVNVEVDEVDIRQVHEGMPARVRLDALPNVTMPGQIEQIAVLGTDQQGIVSYDVKVRLDETDQRVRNGMTAEAAVIVEERRNVLVVPNRFIRIDRRNDQAFVNVMKDDGMLEEVEIELGLQGQDNSEVLAGVKQGDVIALDLAGERFSFFGG